MSYKFDFFDSFVCSGSACKNTCCSGWNIALDKETYDFYEASHGAFSKYVKKNIGQTDGNYFIKMTEKKECPFLDEMGLCKIYQEYGPEHMSNTCKLFPRTCLNIEGKTVFSMLNHSCEEVLKRIFEHEGPLYLVEEGEKETLPFEEKIAEFMSVSMDVLQEESIPLGIGLGAVLYLYMDAFSEEKKKAGGIEIPNEGTISSLLQEFELVKNSMSKEDLENSADIEGPGVIQHIWITVDSKTSEGDCFVLRDLIMRMYWDGEENPSVEVPLGDFFCCGYVLSYYPSDESSGEDPCSME